MDRADAAVPEDLTSLNQGRYVLGRVLGRGGMALVVACRDTVLGVDRAVKLVRPGHADAVRRRLRAEASAMARLRHPNVVGIHDVGAEGDWDYVVMDLAEGGSLLERLDRDGPLSLPEVAGYGLQLLGALAAAHAEGVVHRDVKPHNVLLDRQGRAMLADFGIALLLEDDRRTRTGVSMGSVAYMPPEQRLDAARVGPTADLYAVGATLYQLATDRNPVDLFLAEDDRWAPVPPPLRPVLKKACARRPEDRYRSAGAMAADLRPLADVVTAFLAPRKGFTPAPLERTLTAPGALDVPYEPTVGASTPVPLAIPSPRPPRRRSRTRWLWAAVALGLALPVGVFGLARAMRAPAAPDAMAVAPVPPAPAPVLVAPAPELPPAPLPAPPLEVVPALAPEVAVESPPPAAPRPPAGRWQGSLNGVVLTLDLAGTPDALEGAFTSSLAGRADRRVVTGRFEPASRRLVLEEVERDRADAATYYLDLDPGLGRATGTASFAGGTRPVALTREGT